MATPEINENCHYVQNDPHKCRIKLGKFHFDILCCFGVIKESLPGGDRVKLSYNNLEIFLKNVLLRELMIAFERFAKCWLSLMRYSTLKSSY